MNDERDKLLDNLFSALRTEAPGTAAAEEYFEARVMALIEERSTGQALVSLWSWRLIPWFALVVVMIGIGSAIYDPVRSLDMFASFANGYEEYQATNLLAGG